MHCQRLESRWVTCNFLCGSFKLCLQQPIFVRTVLSSSCQGQPRGHTQASSPYTSHNRLHSRTSRLFYATARPNVMLNELSQAVDLKQACLIAAGVYSLWRLASFFRYVAWSSSLLLTEMLPEMKIGRHQFWPCRADADLSLWSKKSPPKSAFEDQVVWITGASQVCTKHGTIMRSASSASSRTKQHLHLTTS